MNAASPQPAREHTIKTSRLAIHARIAGPETGHPVIFIHGNCSDSRFWGPTLAALPPSFRGVAPDLRGFGATEPAPIDATRGLRDFSDDVHALSDDPHVFAAAESRKLVLVGHSVGAGVALQYTIDHPERVAGLVLVAPMSPFGFGGTKGAEGTPCWPDFAGSGGGTANADFARGIAEGDRSDAEQTSPRSVLLSAFVKPPFHPSDPALTEVLLDSLLSTRISDDHYPGDLNTSENWPGVAPGARGMNNALSPKHTRLDGIVEVPTRPPILWIRGADDAIVSDTSFFDLGYLGQLGAVPGWPGAELYPPQPMVAQTRAVLDRYRARGGVVDEVVLADCGHSPQLEQPEQFLSHALAFLTSCTE